MVGVIVGTELRTYSGVAGANGSAITDKALKRSVLMVAWANAFGEGCPALAPQPPDAGNIPPIV